MTSSKHIMHKLHKQSWQLWLKIKAALNLVWT